MPRGLTALAAATLVVTVAAATLVVTVATPVRAAGPDHAVLTVGEWSTVTPFVTDPARTYQVTVTGVVPPSDKRAYAYDCGHRLRGTEWNSYPFLVMPLDPAPCANMRYSPTHTYTWWQPGTGMQLAFRFKDGTGSEEVGLLVVDVLDVTDLTEGTPYDIDGSCEVVTVDDTQVDVRVLAIGVHAKATNGTGMPPLLDALCQVRVGSTEYARVQTAVVTPVVAAGTVLVLPRQEYSVCLTVGVTYAGRAPTYVHEPCRTV